MCLWLLGEKATVYELSVWVTVVQMYHRLVLLVNAPWDSMADSLMEKSVRHALYIHHCYMGRRTCLSTTITEWDFKIWSYRVTFHVQTRSQMWDLRLLHIGGDLDCAAINRQSGCYFGEEHLGEAQVCGWVDTRFSQYSSNYGPRISVRFLTLSYIHGAHFNIWWNNGAHLRRIIATIFNPLGSENLLFWEPKLLFGVKLKDLTEVRMMIAFAMRPLLVLLQWPKSDWGCWQLKCVDNSYPKQLIS